MPSALAANVRLPLDEATELLESLHADRLLAEPIPRRYQMHDLIHQYARLLAAEDEHAG